MPDTPDTKAKTDSRRLAAIDQMLLAALKQGPAKKRQAINRILELVPGWTRRDCWQRIRHLRKTSELAGLAAGQSKRNKSPGQMDPVRRPPCLRWTPAHDDKLLKLAGYEPVKKIAQRLRRSENAVRLRLRTLGMSAKVTDGWSLRALQKLLRVSPARLRCLIGNGILRVRDPRVTAVSLAAYCDKNGSSLDRAALERATAALARSEDAFSWERTADILGLTLAKVQELISTRQLKLVDLFVTDRAFEEFCKKHGSEISMALINAPTAKWLRNEYGVPDTGMKVRVSRAQKHALLVRICVCGQMIAGNPYFRHIRACRAGGATLPRERSNVLDSSSRILKGAQSKSTKESASLRQSSKGG